MKQPFRLPAGGTAIDRDRPLTFTFDGRRMQGYAGDTLAAALLANGVRLVGRSLKYHRPRGIVGIGPEEPNALVEIGSGAARRPNLRATEVPLSEGLVARSQNAWPGLHLDLGAVFGRVAPLLPAGFQYKTFKWPQRLWPLYERVLRRMAGLGRAPDPKPPAEPSPLLRHAHVAVLVIGGGPAGLAAAEAASRSGARVLLAEAGPAFGGRLRDLPPDPDAATGLAADIAQLRQRPNLRLLEQATVLGAYDHGLWTIAEARPGRPERLWLVRAAHAVVATGLIERPLVFPGNDRPGVMLASAVRGYLHRHGVLCGRRPLLVGGSDETYALAMELAAAGADIVGIADPRDAATGPGPDAARAAGIPIFVGHVVASVSASRIPGSSAVTGARLRRRVGEGTLHDRVRCDLVAMHGGWSPALHLFTQAGGRLAWDEDRSSLRPAVAPPGVQAIGAVAGEYDLTRCVAAAAIVGARAAGLVEELPPEPAAPDLPVQPPPLPRSGWRHAFVDFQSDVTMADLALAAREGYGMPELAKRYTALGMGTDQGKLGNPTGRQVLAWIANAPQGSIGGTTDRPPWVPVPAPLLAAGAAAETFLPRRLSSADEWHAAHGAVFGEESGWRRPIHYAARDKEPLGPVRHEALALLRQVGMVDLGPIGRLLIAGPGAETLLRRACSGAAGLPIGRVRRVLLLRDDGRILTQALLARPSAARFLLTLAPGQETAIHEHLTLLAETRWPELPVHLIPIGEQWFGVAVVGPRARALLFDLTGDIDVGNDAFPAMAIRSGHVAGLPAEIVSHRGWDEAAFEVAVAADRGLDLWNALLVGGTRHRLRPCGTAALDLLRIVAGRPGRGEIDGRTTAPDLGLPLGDEPELVGRRAFMMPALSDPARPQLVGLQGLDPALPIPAGAQLVAARQDGPQPILGHVTSHGIGPERGQPIGLGLLAGGRARIGETLFATSPLLEVWSPVRVVPPGTGEEPPDAGT